MTLTKRQIGKLNKIVVMAQGLLDQAAKANRSSPEAKRSTAKAGTIGGKRFRRTGADLVKMKSDILKGRAKGVSAVELAKKYDVSTAYIYMIK